MRIWNRKRVRTCGWLDKYRWANFVQGILHYWDLKAKKLKTSKLPIHLTYVMVLTHPSVSSFRQQQHDVNQKGEKNKDLGFSFQVK